MSSTSPRLAVRGLIVEQGRLLLVNAYAGQTGDVWCLPGGGVEPGQSLPDNLAREVAEETGLSIAVGAPVLVTEFHDPGHGFHQVEIVFHCTVIAGEIDPAWRDPENIVQKRQFFAREDLAAIRLKPSALRTMPWDGSPAGYDPLDLLAR